MNEKIINILIVEPGKAPRPAIISNTLESAERVLGGSVQINCFLPQRVMLVSREDSDGLIPNRPIPHDDEYISGTFLLCGIPEDGHGFASLTPEQQNAFQTHFAEPGEFMMIGGVVCTNPDDLTDTVYGLWDLMRDGESVTLKKLGGKRRS